MLTRSIQVKNSVGLHARPATYFIPEANQYRSSISVKKDSRKVNAKSLLGVLSLGVVQGMNIEIEADGSDEADAIEALTKLIESGFAE